MAEKDGGHKFKRTILITGSTDGIGRQTALELAVRNKENFVIVHGRSSEKCEATINYIMHEGKLSDRSNLDFIVADFSDLKEVSEMASEVEKRFPQLNVLLCNAGVLLPKRTESRNGLELTFQINHLAHFLIINRLIERLKENQPSRVIIVSSSLHSWHKIDWKDLMAEHEYDKYLQYSRTKLMNHLTSFALHRLLVRQGCQFRVTSNVVDLGNMEPQPGRRIRSRSASLSSSDTTLVLSSGVGTLLTLVESPLLENVSGKYFDCHGKQVNHLAPYILSRSLFGLLKRNAPSRLVLVSSICYEWYPLDWSDLESKKSYEKYTQYSRSKLMLHLTAFKLARIFEGSGVTCNILEPGVIETKLLRAGGYSGAPVSEGSRASIFLCTSNAVANVNGAYYDNNCKLVTKLFKEATDEKQQEDLWKITEKICEEKGIKHGTAALLKVRSKHCPLCGLHFKKPIEMVDERHGNEEFPKDVEIVENIHNSLYIRPMRMKFKRGDKQIKWDLILRHDSVACILYHKQKKSLLFVRQFRPPVYLSKVRKLEENANKKLNEINWSKYPISMGETIELCAGIVDKPNVSYRQHMREEIMEECGYSVNENDIKCIKKFVTGVGSSGAWQELFYAEIDEKMKISEGGGVDAEKIDKVFMTIPEAQKYCEQEEVTSSPGLLYGLMWFFQNQMPPENKS